MNAHNLDTAHHVTIASSSTTDGRDRTPRPTDGPSNTRRVRTWLAVGDLALALGVVFLVTIMVDGTGGLGNVMPFWLGIAGALALVGTLWWKNAYVVTRAVHWNGDFGLLATVVVGVTASMILFAWLVEEPPQRTWQLLVTLDWLTALAVLRVFISRGDRAMAEPVRTIIAGNTLDALAVRLALRSDPRTVYDVQGFAMDRLDDKAPEMVHQLALGRIDHLPHLAKKGDAQLVVVCLGAIEAEQFANLVRQLNVEGVEVALSTGLGKIALKRIHLTHASGRPLVRITPAPLGGWHMRAKRAFDVVGAMVLILLASPVMLLTALAIRVEDRGPALFRQVRVGKGGELFTIFKFRTMVRNAERMQLDLTNDHDGPVFKMEGDPRITRMGRLLRKTSMDELPQLFNIVKGDMSLVGPRPLPVHEVDAAPASFLDRQAVKPGLTGRWQVSGRSDTGFDQLDELDRWYVDNWSLGQDLEILARTVPAVLLARGAR
ncbi:MAG: sugar transferase [Acidimicrobiales bacterium]|nr:sugar transferase [Acidimicrobiia bacterium]NNC80915.1 sugar transferase [Acidimicrobiales bacterium]RZV48100.1 MAG: sugar transferase [Acidimicrobiales bacterium]